MSDYARRQLGKSLSKFGLVETLVWNEQTGNLVSGHQRLSLLDEKHGFPPADYELSVSVVNLDSKKEKELNVWLNNQAAQGHFDRDGLLAMLQDGISLSDIGFTAPDLEFEFGGVEGFESLLRPSNKDAPEAEAAKDEIQAIKDRKKATRIANAGAPEEDADYYLMVVFDSSGAKEQWLQENRFPIGSRFISYAEFSEATR